MIATASLSTLQIGFIVAGRLSPAAGSERYYWDLLHALPPAGIGVRGLVVGDPATTIASHESVESFALEGGSAIPRITQLRRAVGRAIAQSDVVVSHHAQHALPVLDLIRSRPLVVHCHGPLVHEGRAEGVGAKNLLMRGLAERLVYKRAERIIVLSRAFGDILEAEYKVPHAKIRVVPGGVDLTRFNVPISKADARRRLGWPLDRAIVFTVRRLAPTKGIDRLIDAMPNVVREAPRAMLVVAGTGPMKEALEQRVRENGLGGAVSFAGYVDDDVLPLMYRAADMLIVPTVALEGFGLVVVESLACGTPAMVTPVAGLPEVVRDLDPGLILSGSDAADIATAIASVVSGRRRLPDESACREYVQRFDWTTVAARVGDVYREVA